MTRAMTRGFLEQCAVACESGIPREALAPTDIALRRALQRAAGNIRALGALCTQAGLDRVREVAAGCCEAHLPARGRPRSEEANTLHDALTAAARRVRAVPIRATSSIVTAPADEGFGRISAYDTTWPQLHARLKGSRP